MVKCNGLGNEVWGALQPPQHQRGARSLWHRKNHSVISNWITSQTYQKPQINLHTGRRDFWSIIASTCHVLETISHQIFQQRWRILEPFLQCHFFHAPHSFIFSLSFFYSLPCGLYVRHHLVTIGSYSRARAEGFCLNSIRPEKYVGLEPCIPQCQRDWTVASLLARRKKKASPLEAINKWLLKKTRWCIECRLTISSTPSCNSDNSFTVEQFPQFPAVRLLFMWPIS